MKYVWVAAALGGIVACPLAGWAGDGPPKCEIGSGSSLTGSDQAEVLSISLIDPPTTRLRVVVERNGVQRQAEWDPALDPPVAQEMILDGSDGSGSGSGGSNDSWHVSVVVDPFILRQQGVATVIYAGEFKKTDDKTLQAEYFAANSQDGGDPKAPHVQGVKLPSWPQPTLKFSCHPLLAIGETAYAATSNAPSSATRGLGTIPEPVAQTFALLGEIAVERAKSGALAVIKERFVTPLCGEDGKGGVRLSTIKLGGASFALPHTCALLQQLRLEDVLSSGKPLLRAVRDDLRGTIAPAAIKKLAGSSAWGNVATAALDIVNRAIDRGSFSVVDAEAALDQFLDPMSFIDAMPLVDVQTRQHLEAVVELALGKKCPLTDTHECARELIATMDVDALEKSLPAADLSGLKDFIDGLKQLDSFAARVETELKGLGLKPAQFQECHWLGDTAYGECARAIVRSWSSPGRIVATLDELRLAPTAREQIIQQFEESIGTKLGIDKDKLLTLSSDATRVLQLACTARLAIGIVRRCSGGSGCSKDTIGDMFASPEAYFSKGSRIADRVCWIEDSGANPKRTYRLATDTIPTFEAFVGDGLELVSVNNKQTPVARTAAVLRLFTHLSEQVADCDGKAAGTDHCRQLDALGELLTALVEEDHAKAIAAATLLVHATSAHVPEALTKGLQLIGSVLAYAQVYEDTKSQDAAAATAARKKALEGLIDAATDRHGRGGQRIFSLGSNVGLGPVWTSPRAAAPAMTTSSSSMKAYDDAWSPQVRVPIGFDLATLPTDHEFWGHFGWHTGVTLGDLGQFAAVNGDGKVDDVRWDNFLSPGLELGVLFGSPERAINVTLHAEYAPGLFTTDTAGGAWRAGVSVGYYVPFFDFN